jgi:hypothetical protein
MSAELAPEGFERHTRPSSLTDPWQPICARSSGRGVSLAMRVSAAHLRHVTAERAPSTHERGPR